MVKQRKKVKNKKMKKKIVLLSAQARMFFDKLVETAPQYLTFMTEEDRERVLSVLRDKLCTGKPVVLEDGRDLVRESIAEVNIQKEEEEEDVFTDL